MYSPIVSEELSSDSLLLELELELALKAEFLENRLADVDRLEALIEDP